MVMEFAPDGDLFSFCKAMSKKKQHIPEKTLRKWLFRICDAVNYMHSKNIVHRDIKPNNILIFEEDGMIKVTDLGVAKKTVDVSSLHTNAGTQGFQAPEIVNRILEVSDESYKKECDIWSIGITFYVLSLFE